MKAVILEVKDGYAAALTDDGRFIRCKDHNYRVGMELALREEPEETGRRAHPVPIGRICSFALSAAAVLLLAVGIKDFYTPYSIISIDVNPSIEMSANRYDLVLGIEAVNEDAEEMVNELVSESMRYKPVDTVVEAALARIAEGGYQAEDGTTYVMMSANSEKKEHSEQLAEEMETLGQERPDFSVTAVAAEDELLERAREAGTTAGKLYLVDRLKETEDTKDFNEADWLQKPIREIVQEMNRNEGSSGEPDPGGNAPGGTGEAKNSAPESDKEGAEGMQAQPENNPAGKPAENGGNAAPEEPAATPEPSPAGNPSAGGWNGGSQDPGGGGNPKEGGGSPASGGTGSGAAPGGGFSNG